MPLLGLADGKFRWFQKWEAWSQVKSMGGKWISVDFKDCSQRFFQAQLEQSLNVYRSPKLNVSRSDISPTSAWSSDHGQLQNLQCRVQG